MATERRLIDANAKFIEKHLARRLIDGYALVDAIENIDWYHVNAKGELVDGANSKHNIPLYKAEDIYKALASAPTVDAVEVVRCKDCKYSEWDCDCSLYLCLHHGCDWNDGEHFCSYGERRTDNERKAD